MIAHGVRLTQPVYRAHNPKFSYEPASGEGARKHGGRFNPQGVKALYTSLTLEAAWAEAAQGFGHKVQPMTICSYEVDCADVLDLTAPATLDAHDITPEMLSCAWRLDRDSRRTPASWAVYDKLSVLGVAGIIVPSYAVSAKPGAQNVVFWDWGDTPPHMVKVVDDYGRLPKRPKSFE